MLLTWVLLELNLRGVIRGGVRVVSEKDWIEALPIRVGGLLSLELLCCI